MCPSGSERRTHDQEPAAWLHSYHPESMVSLCSSCHEMAQTVGHDFA